MSTHLPSCSVQYIFRNTSLALLGISEHFSSFIQNFGTPFDLYSELRDHFCGIIRISQRFIVFPLTFPSIIGQEITVTYPSIVMILLFWVFRNETSCNPSPPKHIHQMPPFKFLKYILCNINLLILRNRQPCLRYTQNFRNSFQLHFDLPSTKPPKNLSRKCRPTVIDSYRFICYYPKSTIIVSQEQNPPVSYRTHYTEFLCSYSRSLMPHLSLVSSLCGPDPIGI